jgi:hypothetical protein
MLCKKGRPDDKALTGSTLLLLLLQRMIDRELLPREETLALLVDAANELTRDPKKVTAIHVLAADHIRKKLVPRVWPLAGGTNAYCGSIADAS